MSLKYEPASEPLYIERSAKDAKDQKKLAGKPAHPKPCTLHPTPYTLNPKPQTPNPTLYTLHPTPYTPHPAP